MSFFAQPPNQNNNNSGTPAPSGGLFGAPAGNNSTLPNALSGGSAFGVKPATGAFGNTGSAFGSGGGLFGGGNTNTPPAGSGLFGNPAANSNPLNAGGTLGSDPPANAPAAGSGLFGSAPATSSVFGNATSNAAPSSGPSTTNPLFGGGSVFGTPKTADKPASGSAKPVSVFGQPSLTPTSGSSKPVSVFGQPSLTPAAAAPGSFLGQPPKPTEESATPAAAPSGDIFGGGGLFGKKPDTGASETTPAPPTLPAFSLGGTKDSTAPKDGAPSAAPQSGGFFNLGADKNKQPEKNTPSVSNPAFGLFGGPKDNASEKKDAPAPVSTLFGSSSASKEADKPKDAGALTVPSSNPTAGASGASSVAVPLPSAMRGKTIEEIINNWSTELEKHVREFNTFASEVAVWDRALIENGNNLAILYSHVLAAEQEQNDIDQSLDHIEQQQKDLSATLDSYERSAEEILGGQSGSLRALDTGPADTERDKNYMLATELHGHLDDLSGSLMQMIDSVNALSLTSAPDGAKGAGSTDDPMAQIAQILNSHLESLQWIDGAAREVEGKIVDVEKRVKGSSEGAGVRSRGYGYGR